MSDAEDDDFPEVDDDEELIENADYANLITAPGVTLPDIKDPLQRSLNAIRIVAGEERRMNK
ncbi:hypothetical protein HDU67_002225 [Dinochytrium kinnereticum]|nr:hypothetical protein HDU67_002225 [Dinochytrium kinnereticum]